MSKITYPLINIQIASSLLLTTYNAYADHNNPLADFSKTGEIEIQNQQRFHDCEDEPINNDDDKLCSPEESAIPAFDSPPILNISTQIDIRPENCHSFFDDYRHTRRGLRIESALAGTDEFRSTTPTVANFPIVDFVDGTHAQIVKSKDLTAQIYAAGSAEHTLFDSIMQDAEDISSKFLTELQEKQLIKATADGESTIIRNGEIADISLNIVVQAGMATSEQIHHISRARAEIIQRYGFELKVIEIP